MIKCLVLSMFLWCCTWSRVKAATDSTDFIFYDNFEKSGVSSSSPDYWIEDPRSDDWSIFKTGRGGNKVYRVARTKETTFSWLHVFESDVDYKVRFFLEDSKTDSASLGFSIRFNSAEALVCVRYDIAGKYWYVGERRGLDFSERILAKSPVVHLPQRVWQTVRIVARNKTLVFYWNNMEVPLLRTDSLQHQSPGRVAICALNAKVDFDDVKLELLSRQGRVNKGVLEYNLTPEDGRFREGASIVEKRNGDLILLHRSEEFRSHDNGASFQGPFKITWPYNNDAHHSAIRLKSGKLLKMVAEYNTTGKHAFDAPLRYRAKISSDDGVSWVDAGITWNDFVSDALTMNDKLSQMPDGRIFFVITRRTHVDEPKRGHKSVVYFSDDEGKTWKASDNDTKSLTKLDHYCESKVIYTTDGTLRLYTPWSEAPSVHYSESLDNGITWQGDYSSDSLKKSRSSFALVEDSYARRPTFYMIWVYDDLYASLINYLPRDRLALARSYDGKTWEYLMDLDRWISPKVKKGNRSIVQILDPGLTITKDYLFVTIGRSEKEGPQGHNEQRLRVYRVKKADIKPYTHWPSVR